LLDSIRTEVRCVRAPPTTRKGLEVIYSENDSIKYRVISRLACSTMLSKILTASALGGQFWIKEQPWAKPLGIVSSNLIALSFLSSGSVWPVLLALPKHSRLVALLTGLARSLSANSLRVSRLSRSCQPVYSTFSLRFTSDLSERLGVLSSGLTTRLCL